nr:hypothetical protein [Tanacetum cinerariifolium]
PTARAGASQRKAVGARKDINTETVTSSFWGAPSPRPAARAGLPASGLLLWGRGCRRGRVRGPRRQRAQRCRCGQSRRARLCRAWRP